MNSTTKNLLCATAGAVVGYWIAYRRLDTQYYRNLKDESDRLEDYYQRKYTKKADAAGDAMKAMGTYKGVPYRPSGHSVIDQLLLETETKVETLTDPDAVIGEDSLTENLGWETDELVGNAPRDVSPETHDPEHQSLIPAEDFNESLNGYQQHRFTYFSGDDVLCNESDGLIDHETRREHVGEYVMKVLREGSEVEGQTDVLYARNDVLRTEYEISRSPGKYSVEVLSNLE